ncbi:methyltransferase domain-containing protein [Flavobacterium branchiophilum]|uniref:Thiopurine S-methyltransferase n=1 Tax=Flavobacterium branchiophilum TaxID=55197 RepID=A0A2H3KMP9_9FLAO|nr:methyltransferase domain-containing protein [Flavobacterium branchiophilum]PDS24772.1 thiopurine S-methyltransferase [Flavobacterium branchiophilum]
MENMQCCVTSCDKSLDQNYWDLQYQSQATGWDLGSVSPPIQLYINQITNKNAKILIPGCGNAYEAAYLLEQGFTNITVIDIAPTLVQNLKDKFQNNPNITIILGDFFEHQGQYDFIIEQTFFCALPPMMRLQYIVKNHQLLSQNGKLVGLLFNKHFESGPPFGGTLAEYESIFGHAFAFNVLENCTHSVAARAGNELFFECQKNEQHVVQLYDFEGITCVGCQNTVIEKIKNLPLVLSASMNVNFTKILISSSAPILDSDLQQCVAYESKYTIKKAIS